MRQLLLNVAATDALASMDEHGWRSRCLHCRTAVGLSITGEPWPGTTLEHIVPRAWFGKTSARALTTAFASPDDLRNLALACARCNHGKGRRSDVDGPGNSRAREVVAALLAARAMRWRDQPAAVSESAAMPAAAAQTSPKKRR